MTRKQFEAWVRTQGCDTTREATIIENGDARKYWDPDVQLAWEAVQECKRRAGERRK